MTAPEVRTAGCNRPSAEDQSRTDARIVTDLNAHRKSFLTLQANAAMAGLELVQLAGGGFLIFRGGVLRPLADLAAAEAFLAQAGALR